MHERSDRGNSRFARALFRIERRYVALRGALRKNSRDEASCQWLEISCVDSVRASLHTLCFLDNKPAPLHFVSTSVFSCIFCFFELVLYERNFNFRVLCGCVMLLRLSLQIFILACTALRVNLADDCLWHERNRYFTSWTRNSIRWLLHGNFHF